MSFNRVVTKQPQEVTFSHKNQKVTHITVYFNNSPVIPSSSLKPLVIHLDLNLFITLKKKFPRLTKVLVLLKNSLKLFPEMLY